MAVDNSTVNTKVYGVLRHCVFVEMEFPTDDLIVGKTLSIKDHIYKIVSIVETSPDEYAVNVMLQEYD